MQGCEELDATAADTVTSCTGDELRQHILRDLCIGNDNCPGRLVFSSLRLAHTSQA